MNADRRTVVRTTPATARTDGRPTGPDGAPPAATRGRPGTAHRRALGAGLAVGAATYAVAWFRGGGADTGGSFLVDLTGLVFQLGVFCLVAVMWRTAATGTSRAARGLLVVGGVLLGLATAQSVSTLPAAGGEWGVVAEALNLFWPLSMLGMAAVGVRVAVAGRWRGALRAWPLVAATWFPVALLSSALGPEISTAVAGAHLLLGYGVLGLLLVLRPDLASRP